MNDEEYARLTLHPLRVFRAVARMRNFTKAALVAFARAWQPRID